MLWDMIRRYLTLALLPVVLLAQTGNLVSSVRKAAWAQDLDTAERLIAEYRAQNSEITPQFLEALSWAARGASFVKNWEKAGLYARQTLEGSAPLLKQRALDADKSVPIAVGAAIEVTATVLDARGDRARALEYLHAERAAFKGT